MHYRNEHSLYFSYAMSCSNQVKDKKDWRGYDIESMWFENGCKADSHKNLEKNIQQLKQRVFEEDFK
jgi:hypothetical protein